MTASAGLQVLNTYMGTTLRSMNDVLAGGNSNTFVLVCQVRPDVWFDCTSFLGLTGRGAVCLTGCCGSQVIIAVAVTFFVNQRMKREVQSVSLRQACAFVCNNKSVHIGQDDNCEPALGLPDPQACEREAALVRTISYPALADNVLLAGASTDDVAVTIPAEVCVCGAARRERLMTARVVRQPHVQLSDTLRGWCRRRSSTHRPTFRRQERAGRAGPAAPRGAPGSPTGTLSSLVAHASHPPHTHSRTRHHARMHTRRSHSDGAAAAALLPPGERGSSGSRGRPGTDAVLPE